MVFSLEHKISKEKLADFCKRNNIKKLSLFGSFIRGQLQTESDIDILVEFEPNLTPGLFSIIKMEMELTEIIGRKVDLRTAEDLSRYFRDEVVRNAQLQYQA